MTDTDTATRHGIDEAAVAAVLERAAAAAPARERDHDRVLPRAEIAELRQAGWTALRVPEEHGGGGERLQAFTARLIALGAADPSIVNAVRGHVTFVEQLRRLADRSLAERWYRVVAAGELFGNAQTEPGPKRPDGLPRTALVADGAGWVLSGEKVYSSGTLYAQWLKVTAALSEGGTGWAIVAADQPGVTALDDWDGFGQRFSGSGTTRFDRAVVAEDGVFGGELTGPYHLAISQLVHLATLAGIARAVVRDAVALVRAKPVNGWEGVTPERAADPVLLGVLGRLQVRAATTETLTLGIAEELDDLASAAIRARDTGDVAEHDRLHDLAIARTHLAHVEVAEQTLAAATELFEVTGASGTANALALDRHWRNARTILSHNSVSQKPRLVGRAVLEGVYDEGVARR